MKKFLLFICFVFIVTGLMAQTILTESFDGTTFPPAGWTNVLVTGTTTTALWSRATVTAHPSGIAPHSGAGMAEYRSWTYNAGHSALLSTPATSLTAYTATKVKFWMYRDAGYATTYDSVGVYVNTTNSLNGARWIGKVNRSYTLAPVEAAIGWYQYSFMIPSTFNGATNYIMFYAYSRYGNDMYVDDIEVFQPSNMCYVSSTTQQITEAVAPGTTNAAILALQLVTTGDLNSLSTTSITFNTTGTTAVSDITNATCYYTGTSTSFSTTTPFGSAVVNPDGTITFTGSQTLAIGNNYFWLAYDVSSTALPGHFIDGQCNSVTVAGVAHEPTVTDPAGNREIKAPMSGIYTIDQAGSGPRNYISFTAANNELNTLGIGGPVTFNVTSGQVFNVTAGAAPNNYALKLTATGTAANPIRFQKSGTGTNPRINIIGTLATNDVGIFLYGCDYVTFDGIDINDAGTTAYDYLEYGYYLQGPAGNSCNNVIIKNCNVNLSKINSSSKGIYVNSVNATSLLTANNKNRFYSNIVTDCYTGYYFAGNSTYPDDGNEIGTSGGASTINNIFMYGVYYTNQTNFKVFNTTIDYVTSTGTAAGIYSGSGATNSTSIYNNTIKNLTTSSTYSAVYGIYLTAGTTANIYNNTINTLFAGYSVYGIYITSGLTVNIYKNKIFDLAYTGTSSYCPAGIYIANTTANNVNNIYNNFVYDIKAVTGIGSPSAAGLYLSSGKAFNVYHNTVLLNYAATGAGNNRSAAIYATAAAVANTTVDMINNIFINKVNLTANTGAASNRICLWRAGTDLTNISATTNKNLYYGGVVGAKSNIYYNGTTYFPTLAEYKAYVATVDQAAVTEDVSFLSSMTPYNLHVYQQSMPTIVNAGASVITTPFAVTDDIDGDLRNPATPDIGADEFFISGPSPVGIGYAALGNTNSTSSRTLGNVYIGGDASPNWTNYKPRIYYKKSTDNNIFAANDNSVSGWKWTETTDPYSPYYGSTMCSFDIDYGKLTSPVIVNDTIQYFVVAQNADSANPMVTAKPKIGFVATSVSAITSAPTTPNQYYIVSTVNSFPYIQNFEGTTDSDWATTAVNNGGNEWGRGIISKPAINAAHSGTNAWITKQTGNYSAILNCALVSPYFDFSSLSSEPILSFWQNLMVETGWDAGILESSTDGVNWTKVDPVIGNGSDHNTTLSTQWYNNASTDGPITPPKWSSVTSGTASGWFQTTTLLSGFQGLSAVQFRFRFGSDSSLSYDGWAIDDFCITIIPTTLDTPEVSITINSLGQTQLDWSAITGVNSYKVYASDDPTAAFNTWTLLSTTAGTQFIDSAITGRKFYVVVASTDSVPSPTIIKEGQTKQIFLKELTNDR